MFSAVVCLCGCKAQPNQVVNAFFDALVNKDLRRAGCYCTPALRASFPDAPYALRVFNYDVKRIDWDFRELQAVPDGMVAMVAVSVTRTRPPPCKQQGFLRLELRKNDGRWYIDSIECAVPHYEEFVTEPSKGQGRGPLDMGMNRPRWHVVRHVEEPFSNFVARCDCYCASWVQ